MTDEIDIETEESKDKPLHPSQIAVNEAKVALLSAQAERAAAEAGVAQIILSNKQREEARELAQDRHNHVYVFDQAVGEKSVKECIQTLTVWARQDPACDIELQINSPGGSIFDGLALVDFIRSLQGKGHRVRTVALGMAASMGGVLLQVGDERVIGKNAMLLIHQGSLGAVGDYGQVEDRVKLMEHFHDRILDLFVERAKSINPKTTKAFIQKRWNRTDWWIPAQEAIDLGFADTIL